MTDLTQNKRFRGSEEVINPVVVALALEKRKLEQALLSVELMDREGRVLWRCHDLRDGHYEKLEVDRDTPSYEDEECYWRKHVWTLPVRKLAHGKTELVLSRSVMIHKVRIGVHQWDAKVGRDTGLDFQYDRERQVLSKVALPMIAANHDDESAKDKLGPDGLYVQGTYKVTDSTMLDHFADPDDSGQAFDVIREYREGIPFPGVHDELRVERVHLAIAGSVKRILQLFNLYDESYVEEV